MVEKIYHNGTVVMIVTRPREYSGFDSRLSPKYGTVAQLAEPKIMLIRLASEDTPMRRPLRGLRGGVGVQIPPVPPDPASRGFQGKVAP